MQEVTVELKWMDPRGNEDLKIPCYETSGSAGLDIQAAVDTHVDIQPGEIKLLPTGIAVAIPNGYEIQVRPRSGIAIRNGITLINSPGTIDSDYRGEIKIGLINHGQEPFRVHRGDRIAQLVPAPVSRIAFNVVTELEATERGSGGFGHTGVR